MRINKKLRCIVLLALASGIAFGVSAQDSAKNKQKDIPDYQLGTFYVYGDRYKNKSALGGKLEKEIKYIPASVNIVTSKEIKKTASDNLAEALKYETGITGDWKSNSTVGYFANIRGETLDNSNFLTDGMKTFGYVGQQVMSENVYGLEKAEILRGPSSTFNGAGSVSGVINMELKAPKNENFSEVEVKFGSNKQKVLNFDTNTTDGDKSIRLVGSFEKKDLFTNNSDITRTYIAPSVKKKIGDKTDVTVKVFYQKDHVNGSALQPMEKLKSNAHFEKYSDKTLFGGKGWQKQDVKQVGLNVSFNHKFDNMWSFHQKGFIRDIKNFSKDIMAPSVFPINNDEMRLMPRVNDYKGRSYGLDQYIKRHEENGKNSRDTFVGLDWHYENVDWKQKQNFMTRKLSDLEKPAINEIENALKNGQLMSGNYWGREWGLYASHNEKRGKWNFSGGMRRALFVSSDDNLKEIYATTGQLGVVYELTDEVLPYAHWNNSFKPVYFLDKDKNILPPTTGREFEIGLRYLPKNSNVKASIAIYDLRKQNVPDPVNKILPNGWAIPDYYRSIGEVASKGVDVSWENKYGDVKVKANYSYLDSKVTKSATADEVGKPSANSPRQSLSLRAEKTFGDIMAGVGIHYIGERNQFNRQNHNSTKLGGVTVFDAYVSKENKNSSLSLAVKNILNRKYYTSVTSDGDAFVGSGRTFVLSYNYRI